MNKLKVGDKVRFRPHVIEFHIEHPDLFEVQGELSPTTTEEYCLWLMADLNKGKGLEGIVIRYGTEDIDFKDKLFVGVEYTLKPYNLKGYSYYSESDLIKVKHSPKRKKK